MRDFYRPRMSKNLRPNSGAQRKVCAGSSEAALMKRSLALAAALLPALSLPARASCQTSMVGAYELQCDAASRAHDDSSAIDACRSAADVLRECASDGQPVAGGVFQGADALTALAKAYANTNQREKARAAYLESAASLETFAKDPKASAGERAKARQAAAKARTAASAL
jgi:hypothetical protein